MKKTIITLTAIVCILAISIIGCKKELRPSENKSTNTKTQGIESELPGQSARFSDNVSVSQYGFLVFPSPGDFGDYWEFVISSTHEEVQAYLDSLGFNSPGATLYGEEYWEERISEEQAINYLFNEDQIFQVRDVVMKPINEVNEEVKWEFVLTMTSDNLSSLNYESLASGTYDESIMNQFATNPHDESLDFFGFIGHTPYGYAETTANSSDATRPMFGTTTQEITRCGQPHWSGNNTVCQKDCETIKITKTYAFWIKIDTDEHVLNSFPTTVESQLCN